MEHNTEMTNLQEETENQTLYPVPVPKHELAEVKASQPKTPEQIMDEKANLLITAAAASAATICALPIPFADAPILVAEQVGMMASLCGIYHINMKKNALRSIVLAVLGVGGTTIAGKTIFSSLLKLIPGAGSIAGGTIAAATGGSLTAALGKAWQTLCKDVMAGKLEPKVLTSKEGIKLLTTTMHNQLRLEMKETPEPEDVLLQGTIPADDEVMITPYGAGSLQPQSQPVEPSQDAPAVPSSTDQESSDPAAPTESGMEPEAAEEEPESKTVEAGPEPADAETEPASGPADEEPVPADTEAESAPEPAEEEMEPADPETEPASGPADEEPVPADTEAEPAPEPAEEEMEPADTEAEPASGPAEGEPAPADTEAEPASKFGEEEVETAGAETELASAPAEEEVEPAGAEAEPASGPADEEPAPKPEDEPAEEELELENTAVLHPSSDDSKDSRKAEEWPEAQPRKEDAQEATTSNYALYKTVSVQTAAEPDETDSVESYPSFREISKTDPPHPGRHAKQTPGPSEERPTMRHAKNSQQ